MKISNETKVGTLTAIAITLLILGFNYLKGKSITTRNDQVYAIFANVEGLQPSNAVFINGLQVGKVSGIRKKDKNLSGIIVTVELTEDVNIPDNSVAAIDNQLLGNTSIKVEMGVSKKYLEDGDTLRTTELPGLEKKIENTLSPAISTLNKTLESLNDLILKMGSIIDPTAKGNIQGIIANLNTATKSLEDMVNPQTGSLGKSMKNVESITGGLAKNGSKIDSTIDNLSKLSGKLANAKIAESVDALKSSLTNFNTILGKMTTKEGTLGLLLNDRQLYDEFRQTNRSLNTLLDDLRVNPKRYVNISVFGKKDKNGPLMAPLTDSAKHGK
jgi:phospholipid/cholesterol/gamma-HCH transport system substrate-binding protein